MNLYHGTSARFLDSILAAGLRPRGSEPGNWTEYPSRSDMVYLTDAYAPYFATTAASEGEKLLVVEVDSEKLDEDLLHPDEDFIAQALAVQQGESISKVHDGVAKALESYQHHAWDSLRGLGNICHLGPIGPEAISRVCLIDYESQRDLIFGFVDPSISLMNYKFCGSQYRSLIAWLFGDRPDFEVGNCGTQNELYISMMEKVRPGYGDYVRSLFSNRKGIEVVIP